MILPIHHPHFTRSLQLRDLATDTEEFLDTLIGDASDPESREVKAEFKLLFERMKFYRRSRIGRPTNQRDQFSDS